MKILTKKKIRGKKKRRENYKLILTPSLNSSTEEIKNKIVWKRIKKKGSYIWNR